LTIGNTNYEGIKWVHDTIGFGSIQKKNTAGYPGKRLPMWYWNTAARNAERFLKLIQPYARIKAGQVAEALDFRERQRKNNFKSVYGDCLKMRKLNRRQEGCALVAPEGG
jgi:hypothetical protein